MNTLNILKAGKRESTDLNNDYTLPEYIPDVHNIAASNVKCSITNIYVNGSTVTLDGEATYNILLLCEDERIHNTIYTEDFSVSYNIGSESQDIQHQINVESFNCRLISPRKLNCRTKLVISSKEQISVVSEAELICDDVLTAKETVEYRFLQGESLVVAEKNITMQHASQDIELPGNKEEIENIICCDLETLVVDQKHIDNKLYIKGDTYLDMLYRSTNGNYCNYKQKLSFSDMIDEIDSSQGNITAVNIKDIKAVVKDNSFDEMRLIELDYTYDISCYSYSNCSYEIADDMYSTEFDTECIYNSASVRRLNSIFSSNITVDDKIDCNAISDENFDRIINCNAVVCGCEVKVMGKSVVLSGNIRFDVIACGEKLCHFSHTKPFRYEKEYDGDSEEIFEEHKVYAVQSSAQIENGSVFLGTELFFNIMVSEIYERKYIESAKLTSKSCEDDVPLILYYPKKDECLWDVAKKFKCTCNDIMSVNNLQKQELSGVKVLLLPRKKRHSIFNAII